MGSGIKMSVLLFSFAFISASTIDELPEKTNIYVKPVVIDEKSVEYKLDDLNIIEPMFVIFPKDTNESFVGPPTHHNDENHTNSRKLLKSAPAPAPKAAPAPAPKAAPAPAPRQ